MQSDYSIIFKGDVVSGHSVNMVKERAARLFKQPPEKITALFSGANVVLKRGLNKSQAAQYIKTLADAGLVVTAQKEGVSEPELIDKPAENKVSAAFKLAPVGARMSVKPRTRTSEIDTGDLDVLPQSGDILDVTEKPVAEEPLNIDPQFEVAEAGEDLLGSNNVNRPSIEVDVPDFDIEAVGAQLAEPKTHVAEPIATDHIDLVPPEKG